ncbi:hypothetical protein [Mariniflexile sp.]|uniref:hypothetical protein n=1 Tax=Mariniflexile sp. TaxID=1979402 RepID=UPI00356AC8AF
MKNTAFILMSFFLIFSCAKDKVIELPEINKSEISEVNDISAAYLFYDETQPDSLELNRKNLISSTNWVFNVDKRLSLEQVVPKIKFLQDKKANSSHKTENSKNYFTCNDTSITNLGFMEFTNVTYHLESFNDYVAKNSDLDFSNKMKIDFNASEEIYVEFPLFNISTLVLKKSNVTKQLNTLLTNYQEPVEIFLCFHKNLSFQEYITFKSMMQALDLKHLTISNEEFIFN